MPATILLASPIDHEFLAAVFGPSESKYIRALLAEDRQHILVSSDRTNLSAGQRLDDLQDRYLVTGLQLFDYGSSDLEISLASLIPVDEVELLTRAVLLKARQQRTPLALTVIAACSLVMFGITRNIKLLTAQVVNFAKQTEKDTIPGMRRGRFVRIAIRDHGPGIQGEDLPKIFDPYFSTREMGAQKRMGLGLTIVCSVVRKHDGYIQVESRAESGTTVFLYLPAADQEDSLIRGKVTR